VQKNIVALDQEMSNILEIYGHTPYLQGVYEPYEPEAEKAEIQDITPDTYNSIISAEDVLPQGGELVPVIVTLLKRDPAGNPIMVWLTPIHCWILMFMRLHILMDIQIHMQHILSLRTFPPRLIQRDNYINY
jgi:hypothetical protein